jgi:signal transduction histidine kinase
MPTSARGVHYWLRMFAWSIAVTVSAAAISSGASWQTPWRKLVVPFTIASVFTASIVPLAALTMPLVMRTVQRRLPFPIDWAVAFVAMIALGVVGSSIAIGVLRILGVITRGDTWEWFVGSLKTSVVMTLIFGLSISAIETLRARLEAATIALRTKERDEAEARRLAAEAQLASLESRVNPHFLFNTLNSIATLVHDNPAAAERMTTQLASLLRSSLDTAAPLVPLSEELAIVCAYLDIERVRFGDRLRTDVQVEEDARASHVPRLSVQTLVENSVKYAASPRHEGATVVLRASATNGRVRIVASDDGPGFDARKMPEGHGLALLRSRLAIAFGGDATLTIDSMPGRTCVTMDLPWRSA